MCLARRGLPSIFARNQNINHTYTNVLKYFLNVITPSSYVTNKVDLYVIMNQQYCINIKIKCFFFCSKLYIFFFCIAQSMVIFFILLLIVMFVFLLFKAQILVPNSQFRSQQTDPVLGLFEFFPLESPR